MLDRFTAAQLARPSGLYGRLVMGCRLDRLNAAMNQAVFEQLAALEPGPVLEVGFGGGSLLRRLIQSGRTVAGVDISPVMIRRLQRQLRREIALGRADVRLGCAEALPFASRTFQAVCAVNTIYFSPDLRLAFREARRVLAPRGAHVVCFNPGHELRKWPGHRHGFNLHSCEGVKALLLDAGFPKVETRTLQDPVQGQVICLTAR